MFDRIKKALYRGGKGAQGPESQISQLAHGPVSEWAQTQGFGFSTDATGHKIDLESQVDGKPWRMQLCRPTRNYILREELRARAELGVKDNAAVVVINRPLKEELENKSYA